MKKYVVGIDIGGTKIACGIVDSKGKLVCKKVLPTLSDKGREVSLLQVYRSVEEVLEESGIERSELAGIGVCAPGPLDPLKGMVHNPPNLKGWKELPLAELLRKKFRVPVKLENDANAAGIAELKWGAARGYKHVLYVTVSTGIGTAVIIDGKIYHGKNGMAGEGGHVTIKYDEEKAICNCGNHGCIEALASGSYTSKSLVDKIQKGMVSGSEDIVKACGGKIENLNMEMIGAAAKKGDRLAIDTIEEEGRLIGIWLGGMISVLDPEIIVIGGGVALLGNIFFKAIRKTAPKYTINVFASKTPIVEAELRKDVGIYGAASVILKDQK